MPRKPVKPVSEPQTIQLHDPLGTIETTIDAEGCHHAACDLCGEIIKLTKTANRYHLLQHRNSGPCKSSCNYKLVCELNSLSHFSSIEKIVSLLPQLPQVLFSLHRCSQL